MSDAARTLVQVNDAAANRSGARSRPRFPLGFLVSRAAQHRNRRPAFSHSDVARSAARARPHFRRQSIRDARLVPASRNSALLRPLRRKSRRVQLSRLALRRVQRPVHRNSFAGRPGQTQSRAHFRRTLRLRRARRLRLGLHARARIARAGTVKNSALTAARHVQRKIQNHALGLRFAGARRSRNHRFDGSGARSVCASIVVLAQSRFDSRKAKTVRAHSKRISDEPALTELKQPAVSDF